MSIESDLLTVAVQLAAAGIHWSEVTDETIEFMMEPYPYKYRIEVGTVDKIVWLWIRRPPNQLWRDFAVPLGDVINGVHRCTLRALQMEAT